MSKTKLHANLFALATAHGTCGFANWRPVNCNTSHPYNLLAQKRFTSIIGKDKNNKEAAKKSVSIGGGAGGDNARKHCSFL